MPLVGRFLGRVAMILIVAFVAAAAHSMVWPITRNAADAMARQRVRTGQTEQPKSPAATTSEPARPASEDGTPDLVADPVAKDPVPEPELPEYYISVERAFQYWDEGMPFVDARTDSERVVGTIEGAVHLETRHFISGLSEPILNQLERSFPVIIFCAGGECDASENVAQRLIGRGFTEVYIMHEGYGAWEAAGHPTQAVGGG